MDLVAVAENAQDIAAAFSNFVEVLPDQATEILAAIAKLYSVSSRLRRLDMLLLSSEYGNSYHRIEEDLELVRSSFSDTLKDVFALLSNIRALEIAGKSSRIAYLYCWKDIGYHFKDQAKDSLDSRLEKYDGLLDQLERVIRRNQPSQIKLASYRSEIERIRRRQDSEEALTDGFAGLNLGKAAPKTQRSWERERPAGASPPTSPQGGIPPFAPELSSSPTATTTTTASSTTPSTVSSVINNHWAKKLHRDDLSATSLPPSGEVNRCYGVDIPNAKSRLEREYDEVFEMRIPGNGEMRFRFFVREKDHRARLYCHSYSSSTGAVRCCLPLTSLEVHRAESALKLCRRVPGSNALELWACVRFTTMERMVLFFCTFLALRSYDGHKPVSNIADFELAGERELYGGQIVDDNFLHALRLYHDKHSRAIRLQASVLRGEMKNCPIWTAFITHHIGSKTRWLKRISARVIHLTDLQRIVFSSEYTPHKTNRGEHVLNFISEDDADSFEDAIEDILERRRR